jgi:dihydrolipoamide dehydrogenase
MRKGITTDERRRTTVPHVYASATAPATGRSPTAFRAGEVAAANACGYNAAVDDRAVTRPIHTDPEIASVGLTEARARERYGDDVATGTFPWIANALAVMQNETVGWVKAIHETCNGKFLGLGWSGRTRRI